MAYNARALPYDVETGRYGYCTQTVASESGQLVNIHEHCPLHGHKCREVCPEHGRHCPPARS